MPAGAIRRLPSSCGLRRHLSIASIVLYLCGGQAPRCVAQAQPSRDASALFHQGLQLEQRGRYAEAEQSLTQAHTLAPHALPITVALAKLDAVLGRHEAAVQLFREAVSAAPSDSASHLNLAIALASQGALQEALVSATRATALGPLSPGAHHLRGKLLGELNRPEEAKKEFTSALALQPNDPLTLYDFALLCEAQGNVTQEIILLRRRVSLPEARSTDHFLLGRALMRAGDPNSAQDELREAIRLDPENRAALYSLSRALQTTDPAEAARLSERFRALHVSDEELNAIRTQGNSGVAAMDRAEWPQAISTFEAALAACAGCSLEATLEKDLGLAQCRSGDAVTGAVSLRRSLALDPKDLDTLEALRLAETASSSH